MPVSERLALDSRAMQPARLKSDRPVLVVVVDAEEDFDWTGPFTREGYSLASARFQHRAQDIFHRYGVRPAYLVTYPLVMDDAASSIFRELLERGECEIGAQLHPWVTPPHIEELGDRSSYPGNLPAALEREKLARLTDAIEARFGARPITYKAGRYGFGPNTPSLLEELGYRIDTSILPCTDLRWQGGPDFSRFGCQPFWFGSKKRLLGVPVTRAFVGLLAPLGPKLTACLDNSWMRPLRIGGALRRLSLLERITLSPEGVSFEEQKRLVGELLGRGHRVFTFSYHSSSLMAANTPYVRSQGDLDLFLETLEAFIAYFVKDLGGRCLTPGEFYRELSSDNAD